MKPSASTWGTYYGCIPKLATFLGLPSHLCGSLKVRKFFRDLQEKIVFFKLINTHKNRRPMMDINM